MTPAYLRDHVDQPCLDPVVLVQDKNPTPPGIHRHSQWWQDPRTNELGRYLIAQLLGSPDGLASGRWDTGLPTISPPCAPPAPKPHRAWPFNCGTD